MRKAILEIIIIIIAKALRLMRTEIIAKINVATKNKGTQNRINSGTYHDNSLSVRTNLM
jgi:hypothetical protein